MYLKNKFAFYDMNSQFADVIVTVYLPSNNTLGIFLNTMMPIKHDRITHRLKDSFPEIKQVQFLELQRPVLNQQYPFERLQKVLFDKDVQVISWDASSESKLRIKNKLGSPYFMNHTSSKKTNFISLQLLNEKAAVKVGNKRIPSDLETQSALAGYSIPQYPHISFDNSKALTKDSIEKLIFYVAHRTINTFRLFNTEYYQNIYQTKLNLINDFKVNAKVDDTDATICGMLLTNNKKVKYSDSNQFSFEIDRNGKRINLLDQLHNEKVIPDLVYSFYKKIENANYKTYKSILGKRRNVKVPYYDDKLNPTDSYAVFSFGGNHGSITGTPFNIPFNNQEPKDIVPDKKTVIYTNAFSIDADNCYPSMNLKLGVFNSKARTNSYDEIVKENIALKHALPSNKEEWTEKDKQNSQRRLELKKITNTATGAANMGYAHALLPLNNKTMSMRILVNLIIYELGTAFVRKLNAKVINTNTDGIKIAFDTTSPSIDEIKKIAHNFDEKYGLHFEVKKIDRILLKDTNNFIEWQLQDDHYKVTNVVGKLSKGYQGNIPLSGNIDHPIIVDEAVVAFFTENGLSDMSNAKNWITNFLKRKLKKFKGKEWEVIAKPTSSYQYYYNDAILTTTNRIFFSKDGNEMTRISIRTKRKSKVPGWPTNLVEIINKRSDLTSFAKNIDLNSYIDWCLNILRLWVNSSSEQLSLLSGSNQVKYNHQPAKSSTKKLKPITVKHKNSRLSKLLSERD